ncbi:uncharacterized protein EI90DRAFT_2920180, partial [Cantharellus anzutake]|uniref:uncharacterized protein n=1 Tax=Cantharellus anzutake TaxID=1750568 RepID=UPI001908D9C2
QRRYVLINHSQSEALEVYHGRAINNSGHGNRLPFHGAFLFHEMRVRGRWPLRGDRAIPLPISWVHWINDHGDRGVSGGGHDGRGGRGRRGPSNNEAGGGRLLRSHGPVPGSSAFGKVFIPTNPFANPSELQALKESFAKQPNWRAAVMEGTTWEGSADENAAKWRKLNRIDA